MTICDKGQVTYVAYLPAVVLGYVICD